MEEETRDAERPEADADQEEPEVYTVDKELGGWQFTRRSFLGAAGKAVAAAALVTVAACRPGEEPTEVVAPTRPTDTPQPAATDLPKPTATNTAEPTATRTPTPTATHTPRPTNTPTRTPTPTNTPTKTPTPTPALPKAQFVKDVTIPDGTVMSPGQAFTKTWRFKNVGAVTWGDGVRLVFVPGKQKGFESAKMDGPDAVEVASPAPGKTVDVSVNLVAPQELGHYRSYWRLQLGNGEWLENIHYAEIYVASTTALTPGQEGVEFKVQDAQGTWHTWTQPCGSPIPPGAVCICNCVTAALPGQPGEVPKGENGSGLQGPSGETRWMPCGSPIPPGWTCTCNCVSVPACTCDQVCTCDTVCSCVGACTCDSIHYWYPN